MLATLNILLGDVLTYCIWKYVNFPGSRGEPFVPPNYESPYKIATLLKDCWLIRACLTMQASIVEAGRFNNLVIISENLLRWMEVSVTGTIIRVPEVLARYHHHDGVQATRNQALAALDTFRAKQLFFRRHPEIVKQLGPDKIDSLTWDKLIQQGNALHWQGDIENARPIFHKALLAGYGSLSAKLRMLPSLLPLCVHRAILASRKRLNS